MLKRISIVMLIVLSSFMLLALAPMNTSPSVAAQETVVPTIIVPTVVIPDTGSGTQSTGIPLSTIIIIGLLVLLGFAIIVGGMAMASRRQP